VFKLVSLISGLALASTLSAQVEPRAGQWKTWVITSGSALRLPAPPDAAGCRRHRCGNSMGQVECRGPNSGELSASPFWDAGAPGYRWVQLTETWALSVLANASPTDQRYEFEHADSFSKACRSLQPHGWITSSREEKFRDPRSVCGEPDSLQVSAVSRRHNLNCPPAALPILPGFGRIASRSQAENA
jgi:hypothetical protein